MSRKTTVPIYDGDDFERLAALRREVDIAEKNLERVETEGAGDVARLGDDEPDKVAAAREILQAHRDAYDAFLDEAAERAEMWELHPIGHEEFRGLLKEHQPRKTKGEDGKETVDPADDYYGVNTETFPKALLTYIDPEDEEIRTVAEPAFDSEAALRRRIKRLAAGEFETIWAAAYFLNQRGISDPKSSRFSPTGLRSSET